MAGGNAAIPGGGGVYMFGQLCVEPDELPGLVEVDGDALVPGDALADGDAVAACAIAKVPRPLPSARPNAIIPFAIGPRAHARFLIVFSPPGGD